jgi:hypothetical protein
VLSSVVITKLDDDAGTVTSCAVSRLAVVVKRLVLDEADVGGDLGMANDVCVALDEGVMGFVLKVAVELVNVGAKCNWVDVVKICEFSKYVDCKVVVRKPPEIVDVVVVYAATTVSDCPGCVVGDKEGL